MMSKIEQTDPMKASIAEKLQFESVADCLYCGSGLAAEPHLSAADYFFGQIPGEFHFAQCPNCGSLALSPRLTEACLPLAYSSYYTHEAAVSDDVILAHAGGSLSHRIKKGYVHRRYGGSSSPVDLIGYTAHRLLRRGIGDTDDHYRLAPTAPARILDFGCGGGEYLLRMRRLGNAVVGVDFDPASLDLARKSGLEVMFPGELDSPEFDGSFDLVTLAHVIEHVQDPVALLRRLRTCLRPGGQLYLETPNAEAAGLALLGRYWRGLEVPRHLSIPSRAGLDAALSAAGFARPDYHVRGAIRPWLWEQSLAAMPEAERGKARQAIAGAPEEVASNCEFLTLTARVAC
ncbi:MAG: class I SAM-dependent methyltransferase [Novosphingobium sp.]